MTVGCPVLVLHGQADTVVPLEHAQYYADTLPRSRLHVYTHAGHLFLLTRRREATAAVLEFLAATTGSAPGTRALEEDGA
jgi:pimeloyl-ACP methyl ester carboxylesterase